MSSLSQEGATWDYGESAEVSLSNYCGINKPPENGGFDRKLQRLVRTIEGEIIPRLMLAQPATHDTSRQLAADVLLGSEHVQEFTRIILQQSDNRIALSYIDTLLVQGVSVEQLYLDLLAPTARALGDLWVEDLCDFAEVTIGLCRLHQLMHQLSPVFESVLGHARQARRILLVSVPGEQHIFGILMVAEFFRSSGWDVWSSPSLSSDGLVELLHTEHFELVGLSASCDKQLDPMASTIRNIRRKSCNRTIGVMAGGRIFNEHPEMVTMIGADATALDGRQAVVQAETLHNMLSNRSD